MPSEGPERSAGVTAERTGLVSTSRGESLSGISKQVEGVEEAELAVVSWQWAVVTDSSDPRSRRVVCQVTGRNRVGTRLQHCTILIILQFARSNHAIFSKMSGFPPRSLWRRD